MAQQADFFALMNLDEGEAVHKPRRRARTAAVRPAPEPVAPPVPEIAYDAQYEAWACELERTGRYRILRRLEFPPVVPRPLKAGEKLAIIIDTETTGLDPTKEEVIELGMVAFAYGEDGAVGDVIATYSQLREPSVPISAEITKLTGITPDMVKGHALDLDEVARFIAPAALVIAHNARFDRPFCERLLPDFAHKAWACSASQVDWSGFGFEGVKLGYLVGQSGWFHNGHRAVDDCQALLAVLGAPLKEAEGIAFSRLLSTARLPTFRVWAEGAPFDMKDHLKKRGYRWNDGSDGRPKSWWIEVTEAGLADELAYLKAEIYLREVDLMVQKITAFERFRPGV